MVKEWTLLVYLTCEESYLRIEKLLYYIVEVIYKLAQKYHATVCKNKEIKTKEIFSVRGVSCELS